MVLICSNIIFKLFQFGKYFKKTLYNHNEELAQLLAVRDNSFLGTVLVIYHCRYFYTLARQLKCRNLLEMLLPLLSHHSFSFTVCCPIHLGSAEVLLDVFWWLPWRLSASWVCCCPWSCHQVQLRL